MEFAYKGKPVSCKRLGYKLWAVIKAKEDQNAWLESERRL